LIQSIIVLSGIVALLAGVIIVWYVISLLVLTGVSVLFPLSGRRARKHAKPVLDREEDPEG
jgi:hypothetical protein